MTPTIAVTAIRKRGRPRLAQPSSTPRNVKIPADVLDVYYRYARASRMSVHAALRHILIKYAPRPISVAKKM